MKRNEVSELIRRAGRPERLSQVVDSKHLRATEQGCSVYLNPNSEVSGPETAAYTFGIWVSLKMAEQRVGQVTGSVCST
jgi:hypothetical protein